MFGKEKTVAKRGIRTVDKVVTGLILGGVVASIYGIKKYEEKRQKPIDSTPKKKSLLVRVILRLLGRK